LSPKKTWNFGAPLPSWATVHCGSAKTLQVVVPAFQTLPAPKPIGM
jgi:hypothetical protein